MSTKTGSYLKCDKCDVVFGDANKLLNGTMLRVIARESGWTKDRSFDFCPDCSKKQAA